MKDKVLHTTSFKVQKYSPQDKLLWSNFLRTAKNSSFLFERNFMEYHSHKFQDHSLLIFKNDKVVALLPANISENKLYSHQGLSYGGLILNSKTKLKEVAQIFEAILFQLHFEGVSILQLKLLPKIYPSIPADELEYLLFITKAKLIRADVLSVIDLRNPIKIASNRMEGVKKAQRQELTIRETSDFDAFWNEILIPNLAARHQAQPVHSLEEITKLARKFPKNIIQFNVYKDDKIVAGATIFETDNVAHVQYISANEDKQQLGSLDFLFEYLIKERFKKKTYFDFGASNEDQGKKVNAGLLYWKECFGARSVVHPFYEVETENYKKLATVFI